MEQVPVSRTEFQGRMNTCDERFKRDKEHIDKMDAAIETLTRLSIELTMMNKRHDDAIASQDARLASLERRPGKRWDALIAAIITAVVGIVIGFLFSGYVK